MDKPVDNYNSEVAQSQQALTQDYLNGQPPFKGEPAAIPLVPVGDDGNPLVSASDCKFKYAELTIPDGSTVLAVITPWKVSGGPGLKYRVMLGRS